MAKKPIVFVHGLWMHRSSWEPWMKYFSGLGYETHNPPWPGDSATVAECRTNPQAIANRGVMEVADSHEKFIRTLSSPPILIGHSFGGLLVQILLGRGIASAAVAIDPAPFKGVWQLPFSVLKATFPILGNPLNLTKAVSPTFNQFYYGFANALPEQEAREIYNRWVIPAPARPLFQAAFASLNPFAETKVNTQNSTRGPLLITGGGKDNIAPPVMGKASVKKYNRSVITEFKLFPGKGHSLIIDHGWKEVADYSLWWLEGKGL